MIKKHVRMDDDDFVRCDKPHSRWYRTESDDGRRWEKSGHLMIQVLRTKAEMEWAEDIFNNGVGTIFSAPRQMFPGNHRK